MHKIHNSKFGDKTVRFVLPSQCGDVFVAKNDISEILVEACTYEFRPTFAKFFDNILSDHLDSFDRRGAVIELDRIGPVVHHHAIGNILQVLGDVHSDAITQRFAENSYRFRTIFKWYIEASIQANNDLDVSLHDLINSVKRRLDHYNPPFIVNVTHIDGIWVGENDDLGLVTEAKSYDELTERVWEIAPELADLNDLDIDIEDMRITFQHMEQPPRHIAAG
ncbi:DUF1902 domain-containing protein [Acinetobacter ursingii]|uniref:DUF1902 domain-containing protein n=1 Tax=Acinetobacter ursingii TaxID=108980 RepID=UPI00124E68FF|nr:DUF1902 domain-containing protein [Acinetobacter ursingii]